MSPSNNIFFFCVTANSKKNPTDNRREKDLVPSLKILPVNSWDFFVFGFCFMH